ncbi:MAG: hypothetical protein KBE09_01250 [Candidatus Pacebacteria bacterium]|nr:hypothetical protein [Candidatus Paceibacterota bacterium]
MTSLNAIEGVVVLGTVRPDGTREFRVRNVLDTERIRPLKKGPLNWRAASLLFKDAAVTTCQMEAIRSGEDIAQSLRPARDPEVICITLNEPFPVLH